MHKEIKHELKLIRRAMRLVETHLDILAEHLAVKLDDEEEQGYDQAAKEDGPNYSGLPE